ncbi:quinate 5-dehydrogenase [Effusibacillus dendaii]|uniref:Quinate 5-dehydrogenase n=1 Tax=Effusibacillus dendaii TaxID=2743772 RepID=A0A7I8DEV2_9BACL|nr:quinate 5-dehydrogenase [Effusibacillus dendaii]BCJ87376.1 hypothetical protein skT53_23610 [Effusibacillus dendaii]
MKRVVSLSLGSASRDHRVVADFLQEQVAIERIGTDGDRAKLIELIRQLDGSVDAFGMGGIDRYIVVNQKRFTFREAEQIARAANKTPICDGSGLKDTLERVVVHQLADDPLIRLRRKKVLLVSGVDRFGMAEALVENDCEVVFGDLLFGLGISVPIRSLAGLERAARILAPILTKLPIRYLYPTGEKQETIKGSRFSKYYLEADVIAGDFHFIRRYLPDQLAGKIVLTNTVTEQDKQLLRERGVSCLVTTTPHLQGRSFGTNVMEALLVALHGKKGPLTSFEYLQMIEQLQLQPHIEWFQQAERASVDSRYFLPV